ncbi:unnamed protein product [Adineta ricciae]|uniref:NAD(P)(+)--arginine ADP-ribosyltransferase n=1 Tax=Adineta ricciae TaxID=249248 RepID=A0A814FTY4_ADIRI|nr:unnamed protein product [Adineta ricciae]CAF0984794.1 unnamed protein product [Adineta ricciae]
MVDSNEQSHALRICDISEESEESTLANSNYGCIPLVSLEIAIEPLVLLIPQIKHMMWTVKQNCADPPDGLSPDESASIMLYTLEWQPRENSFYIILNKTMRSRNPSLLKPWLLYLKLIMTAFSKIPFENRYVYRGVKQDVSTNYPSEKTFVWWSFSSCTASIRVLEKEHFLGKTGARTLFTIDCYSGKNIRQHSMYKTEDEVLLPAACKFQVVSCMDGGNGLTIIHIKEINSPYSLLQLLIKHAVTTTELKSLSLLTSMKMQSYIPYQNETLSQAIRECTSQNLNLSGEQLNDQDMEIVAKEGIINKQCIILNLMYNQITRKGVSTLANSLNHNECLKELILSYNKVSNDGVRFLATTLSKCVLERVDLSENDISDEGATYLADMLESKTDLIHLSLSANQIGNYGVKMLTDALLRNNTCLELLNLSANVNITDDSISSFVNLIDHHQSLKKLDLRHTRLSESGQAKLYAVARSKRPLQLWLDRVM